MGKRALAAVGLALSLTLAQALLVTSAWAETPTFTLTFKEDGTFEPQRLEVPAGRFKINLINESKVPVEFESLPLRKEKVLGPGLSSFLVFTISKPGEYPFFDDFHQSVRGTLVVKAAE